MKYFILERLPFDADDYKTCNTFEMFRAEDIIKAFTFNAGSNQDGSDWQWTIAVDVLDKTFAKGGRVRRYYLNRSNHTLNDTLVKLHELKGELENA